MNTKKKIALVAAASMLSVGGLYIATTANAATPNAPAVASPTAGIQSPIPNPTNAVENLQEGDQSAPDSTADNQTESSSETNSEMTSDGADQGPDANLNEPGHQDGADAPGIDESSTN